jgi:threonine dehydrogenase-like Zn-dependent dehydrogenase
VPTRKDPRPATGYDVVVEATGRTTVGDTCVPLTRNGGTVLISGVSRPTERLSLSPYEIFRCEITGTYSEMSSFDAAIAALRKRVRTKGIIAHRFGPDEFRDRYPDLGRRPHRAQGHPRHQQTQLEACAT